MSSHPRRRCDRRVSLPRSVAATAATTMITTTPAVATAASLVAVAALVSFVTLQLPGRGVRRALRGRRIAPRHALSAVSLVLWPAGRVGVPVAVVVVVLATGIPVAIAIMVAVVVAWPAVIGVVVAPVASLVRYSRRVLP